MREWVRRLATGAVTAALVAACSSGGAHRPAAAPGVTAPGAGGAAGSTSTSTSTSGPGPTSSPASGPSGSGTPGCRPADAVAGWSTARKVAQLLAVPIDGADPGAIDEAVADGAGGLLLLGSVPGPAQLEAALAPARAAPIPVLVMADEEGGGVQRLSADVAPIPWPQDMGRTMTPAQVRALAQRVGAQMRAVGVGMDLAPVADLDSAPSLSAVDPDGPRSFGADPAHTSQYVVAFVEGLQAAGVVAVAKHFPGLGGASGNTDYGPAATTPWAGTASAPVAPFRAAAEAGVGAVMVANASVPGLSPGPASMSAAVVTGVLRNQLGFDGLVLTDSLSAGAVRARAALPRAAVAAIGAGADMVLFGSTLTPADASALEPGPLQSTISAVEAGLVAAVRSGQLSGSRVDAAVLHVLAAKKLDPCRL